MLKLTAKYIPRKVRQYLWGRSLPLLGIALLWNISCTAPPRYPGQPVAQRRITPLDLQQVQRLQAEAAESGTAKVEVMSALWAVLAPATRGEFETRQAYDSRARFPTPDAVYRFELEPHTYSTSGVVTKYDMDRGVLTVDFKLLKRTFGDLPNSRFAGPSLSLERNTTTTTRSGSNAFGSSRTFSDIEGDEYGLVLRNVDDFVQINRTKMERGAESDFRFVLPCDPQTARRLKDDLRARVGVSFLSPDKVVREYSGLNATIDFPYARHVWEHYVYSDLREVVLLDKGTGKVLVACGAPGL